MPSSTLTATDTDLWGTCRACREVNYTLTEDGLLPVHPVPGYGPGRPTCRGSHDLPLAGSITPATWFYRESANYQPIPESAVGR
jgi:hypothetical protein